jgi:hypothetical protein
MHHITENVSYEWLQNQVEKNDGPRCEQDELIQKFTDRLNQERAGTKYKPLTVAAVAVKLSRIPTADLHAFHKQCEAANSFSRYFWWALKP